MKISNKQWDEWFAAPVAEQISAESELSGIIACMNVARSGGIVRLTSTRLWVYRRIRRLWVKSCWNSDLGLSDILKVSARSVAIELPRGLYRKVLTKPQRRDFIRWPWCRGVFGCVGSIYNPKRGYYCVMRFHSKTVWRSVRSLLSTNGIPCSSREKDGVTEITIRDLKQIVTFCYLMDLTSMAQTLEERYIVRSGRDLANKQANCDSANIRRTLATSRRHLSFIEFLRGLGDPSLIDAKLLPLARLRLEYPEASLSELGDMLKPQVSKSTVKYRLKKLLDIAVAAGYSPDAQKDGS